MKDNEKRHWIALLRSQRLWRDEEEKLLHDWRVLQFADILEQRWFPSGKGGRPKNSRIAILEFNRETIALAQAVHKEMRALKKKGHSTGVKSLAIKSIAMREGVGQEGLRRRLNGKGYLFEIWDGKSPRVPLQKIHLRAREIRKIIDEAERELQRKEEAAISEWMMPGGGRNKTIREMIDEVRGGAKREESDEERGKAHKEWVDSMPTLFGAKPRTSPE